MKERNDPRVAVFANPNVGGEFVGLPFGLTDGQTFALQGTASRPSTRLRSATAPAYLMTHAEMKFFEAEAIERGFINGNAAEAYNAAVAASMTQWGLTDQAAVSAYLAQPINAYDAANWKNSIGMQKVDCTLWKRNRGLVGMEKTRRSSVGTTCCCRTHLYPRKGFVSCCRAR
jgi:hypothetical protein